MQITCQGVKLEIKTVTHAYPVLKRDKMVLLLVWFLIN